MATDRIIIVAETVKYARSGRFSTAAEILEALKVAFADSSEEDIKRAMADAGDRLLEQHN